MNDSSDETSNAAGPQRGGGRRRGLLWTLSGVPALSLMLSLLAHGGVVTLLLVVADQVGPASPRILLPQGQAVVEVRLVPRPVRQVAPPSSLPPPEIRPWPPVTLQIEPPPPAPPISEPPPRPAPLPAPPDSIPEPPPVMEAWAETPAETLPVPAEAPALPVVASAPPEPVATAVAPADSTPAPPLTVSEPQSDSAPKTVQGVRTGVEVLRWPTPRYPASCRRRGEQGLVRLQVEVQADGAVGRVTVLQHAESPKLADAAVAAVKEATFAPATVDGRPVAATVIVPVRFELK